MPNVTATLRKALNQLRADRSRLDRQIAAVESALAGLEGNISRGVKRARKAAGRAVKRTRSKMSAAQKKAVSQRMKAYWAKRRKQATK